MKDQIIKVTITDIVDFGAFCKVDIDGAEYKGLIHISEVSNDFVRNVNDYLSSGQEIDAKILEINEDKKQVKLSIKQAA